MEFCATVQSYGKILMMIERSDGSRGAPTAAGGDGYADGRGEEAKWLRKAKQSLRRRAQAIVIWGSPRAATAPGWVLDAADRSGRVCRWAPRAPEPVRAI